MTTRGEDYYADGAWNAVCYTCGFRFKSTELVRQWQGYYVCHKCFEIRQPQDFVRGVPDVQTPPWVQSRPAAAWESGDPLVTEASNTEFGPLVYITTETLYPITTE